MSLLQIHVLGAPVLREVTTPVAQVTDELRRLIDDMYETMYMAKGIGIAAPQVGRLERLAVVDVDGTPYTLVNPEVVHAEGRAKGEEGCLSIPDVYADVERSTLVRVRATNELGEPYEVEATDLLARCFLHEIDHLHGKLFVDYLSLLKRRSAMAKWDKLRKDFPGNLRTLSAQEVAEHEPKPDEGL